MPEPYTAKITQNPNMPSDGSPITTSFYSTVHATFPDGSSKREVEERKHKREADHFVRIFHSFLRKLLLKTYWAGRPLHARPLVQQILHRVLRFRL